VHVRFEAVADFPELAAAAGLDLVQLRADTPPVVRDLSALTIASSGRGRTSPGNTTAPIVLGELNGSDPKLVKDYAVVAHPDHVGTRPGR
jgi:hypothetical protein